MKIFILFFILIVVLASYPFFNQPDEKETLTGLPWQIEVKADGTTEVFGLNIGNSRLSDALLVLGEDMELAIVVANEESAQDLPGNLEMYYGHYQAGLLSGKLVLQTAASAASIKQWRENSFKSEYMATGLAKKHTLNPEDLSRALDEIIVGVTFIPVVNLDEDVIVARFGKPGKRLQVAGVTHFLYPEKGLDISLHEKSKEVLQYVSPDKFQQLIQPLELSRPKIR